MNIVNLVKNAAHTLQLQRERWVLWSPVPLSFGIYGYFALHGEPPLYVGFAVMAVLFGILAAIYRNKTHVMIWSVFFLIALGFLAGQVRTWSVNAPVLQKETYPLTVQGEVLEVDALPAGYRIVVDHPVLHAKWPPKVTPDRVRIKLKANDPAIPRAGDIVTVRAVLLPLSPPVAPGAFDFQRHAFFLGLGATGYAIGNLAVVAPRSDGFFFEKLRHSIRTHIESSIANHETAEVLTAFLIGEGNGIPEKTWDMIRLSGIAHLLAISGFHITAIGAFMFFGLRALLAAIPYIALRWPVKKISAFISVFGALFYLLLIGSPIPAERSVIMMAVVMFAVIIDRDPLTLRLAAFSAIFILLFRPESLQGPSFQMSFSAVIALISFYEAMRGWLKKHYEATSWVRKCSLYIAGCLATTIIATIATAPYSLFHFSRIPLLAGLFSNMVAVPLSSFVTMPMGVIGCLLIPLGLEKWPLWIAGQSMDIIMATARVAASWKHAGYQADAWPAWILAVVTLGGLWLCIWQGRIRWLGVIPIIGALALIPYIARPDVLVSPENFLFAVRNNDGGLIVSTARSEKFIRGEWIEREGGRGVTYLPKAEQNIIRCDTFACIYKAKGYTVSFMNKPEAMEADCVTADVVFASFAIPNRSLCPAKFAFDKWDMKDDGAHEVYLGDSGNIEVRSVGGLRGVRPWTGSFKRKY